MAETSHVAFLKKNRGNLQALVMTVKTVSTWLAWQSNDNVESKSEEVQNVTDWRAILASSEKTHPAFSHHSEILKLNKTVTKEALWSATIYTDETTHS